MRLYFGVRPTTLLLTTGILLSMAAIAVPQMTRPRVVPPPGPTGGPPEPRRSTEKREFGVLNLQTRIGSFKILSAGDVKSEGTIDISFTGSILIVGLEGTATPTGNLRREMSRPNMKREVWFGTGKMRIQGAFTAIQWFGRDMNARFDGIGIVRLFGEFDETQQTGFFWRNDNAAERQSWLTNGLTVTNPEDTRFRRPTPQRRGSTGGG